MADTVVIDLGRDWSIGDDDRPARLGWLRRLPVAVVAVFTVVLTGAAEPVRPPFIALADIPVAQAAGFALSPDRVFVADRSDSIVAGRTWHGVVAAYALPGGAPRWRTRVPQVAQELRLVSGARVLFAVTHDGGAAAVQTVALDAGTGALLWSSASASFVHAPPGGTRGLLFDQTTTGTVIRWADLRTGRTIWSRALPPDGAVQLIYGATGSDPVWVLLATPDGRAELLAEQTGAVLDVGRLGSPRPPGDRVDDSNRQEMWIQVNVVGARVLVLRQYGQRPATLAAFDLAGFTAQWTLTGDFYGYPNVCGPMVCLSGTDALTAVDPATGTVAWHTDEWQQVGPTIDENHLLAVAHQGPTVMGLLDARTGQVLMRISGWTPVYDAAAARITLVVRPDTRQYGQFWFATLKPDHRTPTLLGHLPRLLWPNCQTTGDLLTCHTMRRTVQIWRYRA